MTCTQYRRSSHQCNKQLNSCCGMLCEMLFLVFSCSTSPLAVSLNMDRFGIESCGQWPSPGNGPWTPMSVNNAADQSFAGSRVPLTPSICLDHLWTESGKMPR